ncbi:integrase catalytic domain-containing protein [Vairimorpha necatrix]|uniref:Integrase catalytic domain-containing protein n=1 Tax=Vairimorpha necatrix TaxID=6039 RepID=A0AAX4JFA8_9MICR
MVKTEINKCLRCKMYNPQRGKKFIFVTAYEPGEKVAADIIGPINGSYIITAIDYFTRKAWAKVITTRESNKLVKFFDEVYNDIKIKILILDQSKENLSIEVKQWATRNNVRIHYISPFHHQSNGRIERFNRTIQEGIYKDNSFGNLKTKTKRVLDVYNNVRHSALGMSPDEACNPKRAQEIKLKQFEEIVKFNQRQKKRGAEFIFKEGDRVIIRRETDLTKGKPRFESQGIIINILGNNSYNVKVHNKTIKRHGSQLKLIVEDYFE